MLTDPINLPLLFPSDAMEEEKQEKQEQKIKGRFSHFAPLSEVEECQEHLRLELSFGEVQHITSGFNLMTQIYEQTYLNKRCLNSKEPLPQQPHCPLRRKLTRKAVIVRILSEEKFK